MSMEIAAIQIPLHNLFDLGTKEAGHPFKTIFIDLLFGLASPPRLCLKAST